MKPSLETIGTKTSDVGFKIMLIEKPLFEPFWHYHPEYELTYIVSGSGKRIAGDSVQPFGKGDLVLLGPDLPHTWNSDAESRRVKSCRAIVFQFSGAVIPGEESHLPVFGGIRRLMKMSARGIQFNAEASAELGRQITSLSKAEGLKQLTGFWLLLDALSKTGDQMLLASEGYFPSLNHHSSDRINRILQYISSHFAESIHLQQMADLVHLTVPSFSRFFRVMTGDTFTSYLGAVRVSHACRLLAEQKDMSIERVATESGFRSSTHFNRTFLHYKKCTPTAYRKIHRE
jgi:AraC-like DNA-binding protein